LKLEKRSLKINTMKLNKISIAILVSISIAIFASCSAGGNNPGMEYAPNMYHSFAYEPLTQEANKPNTINANGMNMRLPAENTIARGQLDFATYNLVKSAEGYEAASSLTNPAPATIYNLAEGKRLFNINCTPCHGEDGQGNGTIVADGKFPKVPAYADRLPTINDGKAFYSIKYGRNLMGAYGTVLSPSQIWQVIHYINTYKTSTAAVAVVDSTVKK
jgi:mono/diheme cytochrome c family protein